MLSGIAREMRRSARDLAAFADAARQQRHSATGGPGFLRSLGYFRSWRRALRGRTPLEDARPWITFAAIDYLEERVPRGARVFEYGGGGSTLFFLRRGATVVTTEHDADWFHRIVQAVQREQADTRSVIRLAPPEDRQGAVGDPAAPNDFVSSAPEYAGQCFERYVRTIEAYDDGAFDVVLIDGRSRPACLRLAAPKVRPGGLLVLDNSDLPHYQRSMAQVSAAFRRMDFPGPIPYVPWFIQTTIWRREQP